MSDAFPSAPGAMPAPHADLSAALDQVEAVLKDFARALEPESEYVPPPPTRVTDVLHQLSRAVANAVTTVTPDELRSVLAALERLTGIKEAQLTNSRSSLETILYLADLCFSHPTKAGIDWSDLPQKVAALKAVLQAREDLRETLR